MDKQGNHHLKYVKIYPKISRSKETRKENVKFKPITGTVPLYMSLIRVGNIYLINCNKRIGVWEHWYNISITMWKGEVFQEIK